MSKHLTSQRYVFKIHSSRLRRKKWNLKLTPNQARENQELIALSESQIMRFIDEINNITNAEFKISNIKSQIKKLKSDKNLSTSRPKIKKLYNDLDKYQFKKDYVCVVIDKIKDFEYIYEHGFKINNVTYRWLLGTTGGVKNNTIVFVNEKLLPELKRRINNGRDLQKEFAPAKLEAYIALVCSSSTPVSMPNGIVVVHDCITKFKSGVIELDDDVKVQDATIEDIKSNPLNLEFKEIKPEILTNAYENNEGALIAINGNYAIDAGLNPTKDAVLLESASQDNPYVNIVACKKGNENDKKIKALMEVLKSDQIKEFITSTYSDGSVIPVN